MTNEQKYELFSRLFEATKIIDEMLEKYPEILQKDGYYDKLSELSDNVFEIAYKYEM